MPNDFEFTISDVVGLLPLTIRRRNNRSLDVDCFFDNCNPNRKGKLNINLEKNCFRCNYCGAHGGMLDLYAGYCNLTRQEVYQQICEALHCGRITEVRKMQPKVEVAPQSEILNISQRHRTYSMLSELLVLSEKNRKDLIKRGLTDKQIEQQGYRSTPAFGNLKLTRRLLQEGAEVKGIPGFYKQDDGLWSVKFNSYCSGILIPYMSLDCKIQGFQIRLDKPFVNDNGKETKYIWLSSVDDNYGTSSGSPVHFIGNPYDEIVYFTEGALKANIAYSLSGKSFLAVAGTGNLGNVKDIFKKLKSNGTKTVVEAYDMDKYKNPKVMEDRIKLANIVLDCGLKLERITWNAKYKGVDNYLFSLKNSSND